MRLTLRNLLAYMDDLLDPESARVIGQKIDESEFASGLLHRIRDVARRSRLGAPKVVDRKESLDPNTVAEYLDNTLSSERVTDFEKVCLESDVELAEVASCHQILTLVLGEPAEVQPESRVRMYHLPESIEDETYVEEPPTPPELGGKGPVDAPTPPPPRPRPRAVPEYLREARRRRTRAYWIAGAAIVLGVVGYLAATGKLGISGSPGGPREVAVDTTAPTTPKGSVPATDQDLEKFPEVEPSPLDPEDSGVPAPVPAPMPEDASPPEGDVSEAGGAAEPIRPVDEAPSVTEPADSNMAPLPEAESVVPVTPTPRPEDAVDAPLPEGVSGTNPIETPAPMPGTTDEAPLEPVIVEPTTADGTPETHEIARLFTPEEMALVGTDMEEPFYRIANSMPLQIGQRIVSLPTSRPVIGIAGNLNVEMVGGAEMVLLPPDEDGALNLELVSGRVILAPADQVAEVAISIHAGGVRGELFLAEATTFLAIEVGRADGPIEDPVAQPAPATVRLWAISGKFAWLTDGDAAATERDGPVMIDLVPPPPGADSHAEIPAWVETNLTSTLDRRASGLLNRLFEFDKPADMILRENVDHRQKEMRRLVRQSLSWIEDFEPIVDVLNEPERYSEWPDAIELLRESVRRSPRTARALQDGLEVVYGPRGAEIYEMLWKFDGEELTRQQARQLVDYLDDDLLACRVMSFRNLNRITGLGYYYRPEEPEIKRNASLQRWNNWAEKQGSDEPMEPADPSTFPPSVVPVPSGP